MSFQIQHKIRQNAIEMRSYTSDLYEWEQEMEIKQKAKANLRKEQKLKNQQLSTGPKQAQIRAPKKQQPNKKQQKTQQQIEQKRKNLARDANTIAEYYKSWDKFDIDKQITQLEQQEQKAYRPYNPYEDSKNNLRAKPKAKINVTGRRTVINDPTELKDKGNLHFQSLQFEKAINCYSQCLKRLDQQNVPFEELSQDKKKLRCVVLSNRCMTYMKIQQTIKALNDANQSIKYNPKYSKSYYRRAECLKKLGKYKESLKDFRIVQVLQPGQSKAESEIKKIQLFLAKRAKQTRESIVIQYNSNIMMGGKRIEIQEIAEFHEQSKKQENNYLQEL